MNKGTKRTSILMSVIMLLFTLAMTTVTFAYWVGGFKSIGNVEDTESIIVGSGDEIETLIDLISLEATTTKELVPNGRISDSNTETDELVFEVKVLWREEDNTDFGQGHGGKLNLVAAIQGDSQGLVHISEGATQNNISITLGDLTEVTLTIKIKLNEPVDKVSYDTLQSDKANIKLKITLSLTPNA